MPAVVLALLAIQAGAAWAYQAEARTWVLGHTAAVTGGGSSPVDVTVPRGDPLVVSLETPASLNGRWSTAGLLFRFDDPTIAAVQVVPTKRPDWGDTIDVSPGAHALTSTAHGVLPPDAWRAVPGDTVTGRLVGLIIYPQADNFAYREVEAQVDVPVRLHVGPSPAGLANHRTRSTVALVVGGLAAAAMLATAIVAGRRAGAAVALTSRWAAVAVPVVGAVVQWRSLLWQTHLLGWIGSGAALPVPVLASGVPVAAGAFVALVVMARRAA